MRLSVHAELKFDFLSGCEANGRQVADAARQLRPNLKVVFITGYADSAVLSRGDLDDSMHIVTKPFEVKALGRKIGEILNPQ